jgi:hypothetical protein
LGSSSEGLGFSAIECIQWVHGVALLAPKSAN